VPGELAAPVVQLEGISWADCSEVLEVQVEQQVEQQEVQLVQEALVISLEDF